MFNIYVYYHMNDFPFDVYFKLFSWSAYLIAKEGEREMKGGDK